MRTHVLGYFRPPLRDWNDGERSSHEHSKGRTLQKTEFFRKLLNRGLATMAVQ
jgi:hypothetical protein